MEEMELTTVNNEVTTTENPEVEETGESGSLAGVGLLVGIGVAGTLLTQKFVIPTAKKAFGAVKNALAKKETDDPVVYVADDNNQPASK